MKLLFLLILILFCFFIETYGNTIDGIVKDINGNPIVSVQVSLMGKNIKTYSNGDGFWKLTGCTIGDTIAFSHFQYQVLKTAIGSFQLMNVTLEKIPIELQPVTISASKANYVIRSALKKISSNYLTEEYEQYGQIREKIYGNDSLKYLSDSEVVLYSSYSENRNDRIAFKNVRTFLPEKKFPLDMINGPAVTYLLDEVKSKTKIFNERNIKLLNFSIKETFKREGKKYFVVSFIPSYEQGIQYSGEIYVESDVMAITYMKIHAGNLANAGNADLEIYYEKSNERYCMKSCLVQKSETRRMNGNKVKCRAEILAVMEKPKLTIQNQLPQDQNSIPATNSKVIVDQCTWKGNSLALDSTLVQEMRYLNPVADTSSHFKIDMKNRNQTKLIYSPNLTLQISNKPFQSLYAFTETYNSINRLAFYKIAHSFKHEELAAGFQLMFGMYLSVPFQGVEAERRILEKGGIKAIYNPLPFNRYFTSFCSKVSYEELNDLKDHSFPDFLRLHTVRSECNYATIKDIEETLFLHDLKNIYQRQEYSKYYLTDIFIRRLLMMTPILSSGISRTIPSQVKESRQPLFANRMASYVHSLLNPTALLDRNISAKKLNPKEEHQLLKMRWYSLQNLISPMVLAIPPFRIGDQLRFTYSLGYLPTILGDNFCQNFWIKTNSSAYRIVFNEYKSNSTIGYGVGFKMIDTEFFQHGNLSTEVNYWKQPENMSYYPDNYFDGFSVSQQLKYELGKTALLLGYRFKTKGYLELAESVYADFTVNMGVNYSF